MQPPTLTKLPTGMTTFGAKLRYLRNEKELTQEDLATAINRKKPKAGITRDLITGWENNRHYPSIATAIYLCDYFKVSCDEMFRDKISIQTIVENRQNKSEKVPK